MKTAENKTECVNVDAGDGVGLSMDAARSARFYSALHRLARSIHSLQAAGQNMQGQFDVANGRLDPAATLRAFSTTMNEDINLLFQMMVNEEPAEVGNE